jgi:hypothetical protein
MSTAALMLKRKSEDLLDCNDKFLCPICSLLQMLQSELSRHHLRRAVFALIYCISIVVSFCSQYKHSENVARITPFQSTVTG